MLVPWARAGGAAGAAARRCVTVRRAPFCACGRRGASSQPSRQPDVPLTNVQLAMAAPIGAAAGFITASVGVGAAAVQVPMLTASRTLALPHVIAASTGMASMLAGALGAAYKYSAADTVDPVIAGSLALPAMATSVVGARIATALPAATLKLIWGCVAMMAASGAVCTCQPRPRAAGAGERPAVPPPAPRSDGSWPEWATAAGFAARLERVPAAERAQHMAAGSFVGLLNGLLGVGGTSHRP
jgi:uncharacterized membrane protein YfcA